MSVFYVVVDGMFVISIILFLLLLPFFFVISVFFLIGVESPLCFDFVLWKKFKGKFEYCEVDLHETLPPLCRVECLFFLPE